MACTPLEHALAADKSDLRVQVRGDDGWDDTAYVDLHSLGLIVTQSGWTIGSAKPTTTLTAIAGMDGSADSTEEAPGGRAYHARRKIEIPIAAVGDRLQIMEAMAGAGGLSGRRVRIQGLLPDPLLAIDGRVSLGDWTLHHDTRGVLVAATSKITITAMPYAYGPTERIYLKPGDNTCHIAGSAAVLPFVSLDSIKGSDTPQAVSYTPYTTRTVKLMAATASTTGWSFWCDERVCMTGADYAGGTGLYGGGAWLGLALSADWLELAPGPLSIYCSTTGFIDYNPAYAF